MSEIHQNILVIVVVAVIVGAIFLLIHQQQARSEQELRELASANGWEYQALREPLAWGVRITAPTWTIEALSRSHGAEAGPGSSNIAMITTWHSDLAGSTLLIGPRPSDAANLGPMGSLLLQKAMELTLGAEAAGVREVAAGSEALRRDYSIWASDGAKTEELLTADVEAALLAWRGEKPFVKRTSGGLSIELRGVRLKKRGEILALASLGETLLAGLPKIPGEKPGRIGRAQQNSSL